MNDDFDIRQLRVFAMLAKTGSHTRTAESMHVTPSAVSHGMKRLEEQAGCALFFKKGKRSHLTAEGRQFLAKVQQVFAALKEAAAVGQEGWAESRAALRVIFPSSIAHRILAPVLREFRECCPQVSVVANFDDTPQAALKIEEGEADLAIVIGSDHTRSLAGHELFEDEMHFVFSPVHEWAGRQRLHAVKLSGGNFLLYQKSSETFRLTEQFFLKAGVRLSSYVEVPDFEIMKQLARLGLGVGVMALWAADKELREGTLLSRPLPQYPVKRRWQVAHRRERVLKPYERTFIGLCRLACEQKPGEG